MTTYYIENNGAIVLSDEDKERLINTLDFMPDYKELEIKETENLIVDGAMYSDEEYTALQEEKEQERINKLTMTALDFINVLQNLGLTLEEINAYLEANLSVGMQLKYCNSVYCGIAKSLMPITLGNITITADMIETAFKTKNGEG